VKQQRDLYEKMLNDFDFLCNLVYCTDWNQSWTKNKLTKIVINVGFYSKLWVAEKKKKDSQRCCSKTPNNCFNWIELDL